MAIYSWFTFSRGWFSISMLVFHIYVRFAMDLGVSWNWGVPKPLNGRGLSWWHLHPVFSTSELCSTAGSLLRTPNPVISDQLKPFPNRWNQKVYSNSKKDAEKVGLATISVEVHTFLHRFGGSPELEPKSAPSAQGIAKSCCALAMSTGLQNRYPRFDSQDYL